jgi:N6-L-threonylcarbamoyladenine synthase
MAARTRILGIESSCDETSAAVVVNGSEILSNVVSSQVAIHREYGGVVPELASREHLRKIVPVVREALSRASLTLDDVDAFAVTHGPGLIGALLVGLTYAKGLALSLGRPLIGVNHLEGHVHAVLLEAALHGRRPEFPAICLIVSGGHTLLYFVEVLPDEAAPDVDSKLGAPTPHSWNFRYTRLGSTRDDAAGEAGDKVAKMLALGYPGGPILDQLAPAGNNSVHRFAEPKMKGNALDFSFSGIKTAVLYYLRNHPELAPEIEARGGALAAGKRSAEELRPLCSAQTLDLIASFQHAVVNSLFSRTAAAVDQHGACSILVSGGVAANSELRRRFEKDFQARGLGVFFPSRALCTDNAAMIAAAAWPRYLAGEFADAELAAHAVLPLA